MESILKLLESLNQCVLKSYVNRAVPWHSSQFAKMETIGADEIMPLS